MRWPWNKKKRQAAAEEVNNELRPPEQKKKRNRHRVFYCACNKPVAVSARPLSNEEAHATANIWGEDVITLKHAKKKHLSPVERPRCKAGNFIMRAAQVSAPIRNRILKDKGWES